MNRLADIPTMNLQPEAALTVAYLRGRFDERDASRAAAYGAIRSAVTYARYCQTYAEHLDGHGIYASAESWRNNGRTVRRCIRSAIGSDKA